MARLQTTPYGVWQQCSCCLEWLPADEEFFFRCPKSPTRLVAHCKVCSAAARPHAKARARAAAPARCTDALARAMAGHWTSGG